MDKYRRSDQYKRVMWINTMVPFYGPVSAFRLTVNLMAQNDNDFALWLNPSIFPYLAFMEIESTMILDDIEKICQKLSFGYISRLEKRLSLVMPSIIKQLVVKHVIQKACIYREAYFNQETGEPLPPPPNSPTLLKVEWKRKYWEIERKAKMEKLKIWQNGRPHNGGPRRSEDGQIQDVNPNPTHDKLLLESVQSLSD